MTLHDNWRYLLRKSWAVRWMALAGVCSAAEMLLPLYLDSMPRLWFAGASALATMLGIYARILAQPKDGL